MQYMLTLSVPFMASCALTVAVWFWAFTRPENYSYIDFTGVIDQVLAAFLTLIIWMVYLGIRVYGGW